MNHANYHHTLPGSHVMGKVQSDLISTTKDKKIALEKFGSEGQTVVEIDLTKVTGEVTDASSGVGKGRVFARTKSDKEVFVRDTGSKERPVPPEAIKIIREKKSNDS